MFEALEIRETFGYVGTWKHLDKHREVGRLRRLSTRVKKGDPEDYCEPLIHRHIVRVEPEKGATVNDIKKALRDHYSAWGCSHEYDCCGCRSYSAHAVRKLMDGTYLVTVHSSRNF